MCLKTGRKRCCRLTDTTSMMPPCTVAVICGSKASSAATRRASSRDAASVSGGVRRGRIKVIGQLVENEPAEALRVMQNWLAEEA